MNLAVFCLGVEVCLTIGKIYDEKKCQKTALEILI